MYSIFRKVKNALQEMSIFQKMITSLVFVIILPIFISYRSSIQTTRDIIINRICDDTLNSISLVSNSVDALVGKMITAALYVDTDDNIKEILKKDDDLLSSNYQKLLVINELNKFIDNISYNIIGVNNFITVINSSGTRYTNWNVDGHKTYEIDSYFSNFTVDRLSAIGNKVLWRNIEKNTVYGSEKSFSHMITLTKLINDVSTNKKYGVFILSIPEVEFSKLIMDENTNMRVMLDEDSKIIAAADKSLLGKKINNIINTDIPSDSKGWFVTDGENNKGRKSIITYHSIKRIGWQIVDIKSYDTITGELSQVSNKQLAISLSSVVFFLFVAFLITRGITRPLSRLSMIMLNTDLGSEKALRNVLGGRLRNEVRILEESFHIMNINMRKLMEDNVEKEKRKREYEIKGLQAQIMPHFLFNTLNAIRWSALNNRNDKAADMTLALIRLLKMTIVDKNELIPVQMEIDNLKSYVKIIQMRHENKFNVFYNVEDAVLQYKIPKLLLQPILENSIVHGLKNIEADGVVRINGFESKDGVILQIEDNGCGIDADTMHEQKINSRREFSGIGINNVAERIKLYYGPEYGLSLRSKPGSGTLVEIHLPKLDKGVGEE